MSEYPPGATARKREVPIETPEAANDNEPLEAAGNDTAEAVESPEEVQSRIEATKERLESHAHPEAGERDAHESAAEHAPEHAEGAAAEHEAHEGGGGGGNHASGGEGNHDGRGGGTHDSGEHHGHHRPNKLLQAGSFLWHGFLLLMTWVGHAIKHAPWNDLFKDLGAKGGGGKGGGHDDHGGGGGGGHGH